MTGYATTKVAMKRDNGSPSCQRLKKESFYLTHAAAAIRGLQERGGCSYHERLGPRRFASASARDSSERRAVRV